MSTPATRDESSLVDLLTPLVRRWRLMIFFPMVVVVATAVYSLYLRPMYTSLATFAPENSTGSSIPANLAGLAGLAGQFGFTIPGTSAISADFFTGVLRSRELMTATLTSEFVDHRPAGHGRAPLIDILEIRAPTEAARITSGVRRLGDLTVPTVDRRTGIVALSARMPDAQLAADVANRMVELLNTFNLERRQSQSREQRRFAEERLASARAELHAAEGELQRFLLANREYEGSPLLTFDHDRLAREVQVKQSVYQGVSQSFEDAKIQEVRDTPVLTIIDRAVPPTLRTSPRRRVMVLLAGIASLGLAAVIAYTLELRSNLARENRADYRSLVDAIETVKRDVRSILGRSA